RRQGVLVLHRRHRLHGVRSADGVGADLGQPEMVHLAGLDELFHRAGDIFDRDVGVDAVLVEEVDVVGAESPEHGVDDLADVFGPAVEASPLAGGRIDREPELRGDDHLVAHRGERFADKFFVDEGAVGLGGVEEGDPAVDGVTDQLDPGLAVGWGAVVDAQSHAAEPDGGDFGPAGSELPGGDSHEALASWGRSRTVTRWGSGPVTWLTGPGP